MFKFLRMSVIIILCGSSKVYPVTLHQGEIPDHSFKVMEQRLTEIWEYVKVLGHAPKDLPPPHIYLSSFSTEDQPKELTEWQATWLKEHPLVPHPFPKTFRGFHYDGTNKIQIDPQTTFFHYQFYSASPAGVKTDWVGYGYYVAAHEMLHYVLETRGVPALLHHCVFILKFENKPSFMERISQYLIDKEYSSKLIVKIGVQQELILNPCGRSFNENSNE